MHHLLEMLRNRDAAGVARGIRDQAMRTRVSVGLQRDLRSDVPIPCARIPIEVRTASGDEILALLSSTGEPSSWHERRELAIRQSHASQCLGQGFVAQEPASRRICFIQWVLRAEDNTRIRSFFKGRFPPLMRDEALFENAYTPPDFRGLGIMPAAMGRICEIVRSQGARLGITFVDHLNEASLRGCRKAGFVPYLIRRDYSFCGGLVRRRVFSPLTYLSPFSPFQPQNPQ